MYLAGEKQLVGCSIRVFLLFAACVSLGVHAESTPPNPPATQASSPASGSSFLGSIGGFLSGIGKGVSKVVTGARDTPVLADLKTGVYEKSNEAISEQKDIDEARITRGILSVPSFTKYANRILDKLKAASHVEQIPGQVLMVANEQLDAYSSADGNIYLSAGYLRSLKSEDQLAALLAHELSHVLLRHHDSNGISRAQKQISTVVATGMAVRNALEKVNSGTAGQAFTPAQTDALTKMELLIKLNDGALGPAWGRRQETEADQLGMDLMVKAGYSYADGMLGWLELISKWDEEQAAKHAQDVQIQQAAMKTLMDAGKFDQGIQQSLNFAVTDVLGQLKSTHDSGDKREEAINDYFVKAYKEQVPQVASTVKPLQALKATPDVKAVIDGYREAYLARTLIQNQQYDDALRKLTPLVGKKSLIASHALPNQLLYEAYRGKGKKAEAESYLRRSFQAPDSVWETYDSAATYFKDQGKTQDIIKVGQTAFNRFSGAPSAYPKLITLYKRNGLAKEAEAVRNECLFKQADKRDECMIAANGS
jgi:predicted Zn-dependent protease